MNKVVFFWFILSYTVGNLQCASTTRKPNSNKNTTSNVVTVASLGPTTTQRPLFQGVRLPCTCLHGQCGCCTGVILERFKQKACMNITYEPDDFAFTAAMSLNERVLYKNTVSGKNPPPMCLSIPRVPFIDLCVEFSNVYFANRNMHVCVGMEANWQSFTVLDLSFNCIRMGINGLAVIGPEEGGGLPLSPIDEEEQVDEDYDDSARDSQLLNWKNKNGFSSTSGNATKSNLFKYADRKNNFKQTNSSYDMKNALATNTNRIPISVRRLVSGDFLITLKENSTLNKDVNNE